MTTPEEQLKISEQAFDLIAPVVGLAAYALIVNDNLQVIDEILDEIEFDHPAWEGGLRERIGADFEELLAEARQKLNSIEGKLS